LSPKSNRLTYITARLYESLYLSVAIPLVNKNTARFVDSGLQYGISALYSDQPSWFHQKLMYRFWRQVPEITGARCPQAPQLAVKLLIPCATKFFGSAIKAVIAFPRSETLQHDSTPAAGLCARGYRS
jgi:hypothetical protein